VTFVTIVYQLENDSLPIPTFFKILVNPSWQSSLAMFSSGTAAGLAHVTEWLGTKAS
jgi:hypothetical protein